MAMRDGVCPECGSEQIYTRSGWFHNMIVAFMPPKTKVYVCGNCGYLAEFVVQGGHLKHIKKRWKRHAVTEKVKRDQHDV